MTWHRTWLIQCNVKDCGNAALPPNTQNPDQMPEGWSTDGTQHVCPSCAQKAAEQKSAESEGESSPTRI